MIMRCGRKETRMLRRICNKCEREIPDGESYYSLTLNHIGKDPVLKAVDISYKTIAMDMCEECFEKMMKKEEIDEQDPIQ